MYQCWLIDNACYRCGERMRPAGIVVHSTAANNPYLSRYVQPLSGQTEGITLSDVYMRSVLGVNKHGNDWNRYTPDGRFVCVNAFIGRTNAGNVEIVQTLPWDLAPWGCGIGENGSYNANHIQFEICEDSLTNEGYYREAVRVRAVELCALLCKKYNLAVNTIVSHAEAHKLGYAVNHGDIDHWLKLYGHTMDDFREWVAEKIQEGENMNAEERREFEALKNKVAELEKIAEKTKEKYNWVTACPKWARDEIHAILAAKALKGDGDGLGLSEQMIRAIIISKRYTDGAVKK